MKILVSTYIIIHAGSKDGYEGMLRVEYVLKVRRYEDEDDGSASHIHAKDYSSNNRRFSCLDMFLRTLP